jgi:hypothetical protein
MTSGDHLAQTCIILDTSTWRQLDVLDDGAGGCRRHIQDDHLVIMLLMCVSRERYVARA